MWAEPDAVDLTRFAQPGVPRLMSFGIGTHYCLGAALARMTLEEAVRGGVRRRPAAARRGRPRPTSSGAGARPQPASPLPVAVRRLTWRDGCPAGAIVVVGAGTRRVRRSRRADRQRSRDLGARRAGGRGGRVRRRGSRRGRGNRAAGRGRRRHGDRSSSATSPTRPRARGWSTSRRTRSAGSTGWCATSASAIGRDLEGTSVAEWDAVFAVNVRAHFLLCRAALPRMTEGGVDRVRVVGRRAAAGHAHPGVRHVEGRARRV